MSILVNALDATGAELVITQGSAFNLDYVLTKDGGTYPLNGKTVVCTIREEFAPQDLIDAAFEDRPITVGGGSATAANGGCFNQVNATDAAKLGPGAESQSIQTVTWYVVQTKVVSDSFKSSQVLRFGVRKDID
jgi:hypothetical protein